MNRRNLLRLCSLGLVLATPLAVAGTPPGGEPGILDWAWEARPLDTADGLAGYRITLRARIAKGYIIYGSDFDAELGPRPTKVRYEADPEVQAGGSLESVGTQRRRDSTFGTEYTYFDGAAELFQVVRVPAGSSRIAGTIVGQTCHEADGTCALFSQRFDIPLR